MLVLFLAHWLAAFLLDINWGTSCCIMNEDIKKVVQDEFVKITKERSPNHYSIILLAVLMSGGTNIGFKVLGNEEIPQRRATFEKEIAVLLAEKEVRQSSIEDLQRQIIRQIDGQSAINANFMAKFQRIDERFSNIESTGNKVSNDIDFLKRQRWIDNQKSGRYNEP